jgi:recombinational DNA repair protein (RecF pathway)
MREFVTDVFILAVYPRGEYDTEAVFFSPDFGKFRAVLVSGRKPTSKFSPHCIAGRFATVRIVHKNRFTVTDILSSWNFSEKLKNSQFLKQLFLLSDFLDKNLPELEPNIELWQKINGDFSRSTIEFLPYLSMLGYDTALSTCVFCGSKNTYAFMFKNQEFLCKSCLSKTGKNELSLTI